MTRIILVKKTGELQEINYDSCSESLFKKAGYKKAENFESIIRWDVERKQSTYSYTVFGSKEGKANYENKYEFPPPIDNVLLFNSCVIVKTKGERYYDLLMEEWLEVYEKLYGGFEDLNSEEESEEEYEGELTRSGYAKDGFVVDEESDELSDSEEEEIFFEDESDESHDEVVNKLYNTRSKNIESTVFTGVLE
tara:strand:- start:9501 stop:10082 length:582 start_codon:yes stop_codon:yes gene_type:complete